jgi:hypothetical protein
MLARHVRNRSRVDALHHRAAYVIA